MRKAHWPLVGILAAVCLFVAAGACYPGGTTFSAHTVGFDWTRNYISSLFREKALNGSVSLARYFAIPAMAIFCGSLGFVFRSLVGQIRSKIHRKTVEIAGIGSMVYAFLVVTPLHDLMVAISLLFFLTAMVALIHLLYVSHDSTLFVTGSICLALLLTSAVMYYGAVLTVLLPMTQKVVLLSCAGWLFAIYYRAPSVQPDGSVAIPALVMFKELVED